MFGGHRSGSVESRSCGAAAGESQWAGALSRWKMNLAPATDLTILEAYAATAGYRDNASYMPDPRRRVRRHPFSTLQLLPLTH